MTSAALRRTYVAAITAAGLGALGVVLPRLVTVEVTRPVELSALVALLVISEQFPVRIDTRNGQDLVTLSGAFCCALLLHWDASIAVAAQCLASLLSDVTHRVRWYKTAFNVAQFALSVSAAGLVVHLLGGELDDRHLDAYTVVVALLAGVTFFLVNDVVTGTALALEDGSPVLRSLAADLPFQAALNGGGIALTPLLIAAADDTLLLIPLLLLPLTAVHYSARARIALDRQALEDRLTGLPNGTRFRRALLDSLDSAKADREHVGVLLLDVKHFSEVNDTLGHAAGDELLQQVARRLQESCGPRDSVARFGGDQFAMIRGGLRSPWEVGGAADKVRDALVEPFELAGAPFDLSVAIGLSVYPLHGEDADQLLQHSNAALSVAKRTGSSVEIYGEATGDVGQSRRRLALLGQLRQALLRHELVVHYQPKADTGSGRVVGLEALVRWRHPELGLVMPDEFIPLAERSGLIRQITDYVLDEVLRQLSDWRDAEVDVCVAVNLSARDLHDLELPNRVARRLALWGVPGRMLGLEITETSIMEDTDRAVEVLGRLRALHISLAIDDYGTGYSSLSYLSRLPVHEIKIDKSFVHGMLGDGNDRIVVRSTIDLARSLGLHVVAEGVENSAQSDMLSSFGCRYVQGYHVGRPVPESEELRRRLSRDRPSPQPLSRPRPYGPASVHPPAPA
jgi:diguanylate cyclase (GGDEF)-like protein